MSVSKGPELAYSQVPYEHVKRSGDRLLPSAPWACQKVRSIAFVDGSLLRSRDSVGTIQSGGRCHTTSKYVKHRSCNRRCNRRCTYLQSSKLASAICFVFKTTCTANTCKKVWRSLTSLLPNTLWVRWLQLLPGQLSVAENMITLRVLHWRQ